MNRFREVPPEFRFRPMSWLGYCAASFGWMLVALTIAALALHAKGHMPPTLPLVLSALLAQWRVRRATSDRQRWLDGSSTRAMIHPQLVRSFDVAGLFMTSCFVVISTFGLLRDRPVDVSRGWFAGALVVGLLIGVWRVSFELGREPYGLEIGAIRVEARGN